MGGEKKVEVEESETVPLFPSLQIKFSVTALQSITLNIEQLRLDISTINTPNYKNLARRSLVDEVRKKKVKRLPPTVDELIMPLSQLAIAWCTSNPDVSLVVTGATKESQVQENTKAIDVIPLLMPQVLEKIEVIVQSKPKGAELYMYV